MKPKPGEMTVEEQFLMAGRRTERLINTRERSEAELRNRLLRTGFAEQVVEREVARCVTVGLVDDERFTRLFIAGKKRSGWGRRRIEQRLRGFGIELRRCEGYPALFFDEDDELRRARACLERFHSSAKDQQAARFRRLLSKGFSTQIAQKALKEATCDEERSLVTPTSVRTPLRHSVPDTESNVGHACHAGCCTEEPRTTTVGVTSNEERA